jgi:hypothetical protein
LARLLDRYQRGKREGFPRRRSQPWTPEEDELVRTLPPAMAAARMGRGLLAVYQRRHTLGAITIRGGPVPRDWTSEEDEMVRTLPAREVAQRTGRSLTAIYVRRHQLGVKCR